MHKAVIFSLILSLLLVIFALQNTAEVSLNLWFWSIHTSLALLVIVLLVLGALMGYLLVLPTVFKKDKLLRDKSIELKNAKRGNSGSQTNVEHIEK